MIREIEKATESCHVEIIEKIRVTLIATREPRVVTKLARPIYL